MAEKDNYDTNIKYEADLNCIIKDEIDDTSDYVIMPSSIMIKEENYDINVKCEPNIKIKEESTEKLDIKILPKLSDQLREECTNSIDIKKELNEDDVAEEMVVQPLPNSGPYQKIGGNRDIKKKNYNHIKQILLCKSCQKFYTITTYFEGSIISIKWKQRSRCPICNKKLRLM